MDTVVTGTLTPKQLDEINNLINLCKSEDNMETPVFLESDMNEFPDFPCFFLIYDGSQLAGFISVFIPDPFECEVYAYTRPDYRGKGCFKTLFRMVKEQLDIFDIPTVMFVNCPESRIGVMALISIGASFHNSDYILKYDSSQLPVPGHFLNLEPFTEDGVTGYRTFLDGRYIGECFIDDSLGSSTIYSFEIHPALRGMGYGRETLLLVLEELLASGRDNIILHLSGSNKAAYRLYTTNGFQILHQVDYWEYLC
ncbi:GNAT family N-acetyltransferase [Parasporobacterium paucivorans]|uniref:Acetyltransferase (GNAT) family protein n=1 Tax=Parasporobacterium paucivorans DSM 15970 TaxID=1122934 RepID=A0A1M6HMT4_9FIRM|nr:GNAT family N-acetyltransferase [Parasporobacterium paucivorans]SHJ23478.1 Acetyltransferase (GNAT) family protein [Parasporobacterium paucivorans DSM 15970]